MTLSDLPGMATVFGAETEVGVHVVRTVVRCGWEPTAVATSNETNALRDNVPLLRADSADPSSVRNAVRWPAAPLRHTTKPEFSQVLIPVWQSLMTTTLGGVLCAMQAATERMAASHRGAIAVVCADGFDVRPHWSLTAGCCNAALGACDVARSRETP